MCRTQSLLLCMIWIILAASYESIPISGYDNACLTTDLNFALGILINTTYDKSTIFQCCPGYAGPVENCQPVCSKDCGPNAFCNWPEHCACIDDDYEQIKGGQGCKLKNNRNLCVGKELTIENPKITFRSNSIIDQVPMMCCEGYERLNESEPCLRKVDKHECTVPIQVAMKQTDIEEWKLWDLETKDPNATLPLTKTEMRRVCCDGYKRQTTNGPCLKEPEITETVDSSAEWLDNLKKIYEDLYTENIDSTSVPVDDESPEQFATEIIDTPDGTPTTMENELSSTTDPTLHAKEVESEAKLSADWLKIKEAFDRFDIAFPTDLLKTTVEKEVPSPKDPNLCTREVESETTLAPDWMKIKEAFDSFNIPFPNNLFPKKIETFCCTGYAKNDNEDLCKPMCQPDCGANSDCKEPNKCVCRIGFHQKAGNDLCVPDCSEQTKPEHSSCISPEAWECDLGYIKLPKPYGVKEFECQPHCVHSCSSYGKCVAPNVCECLPGYKPISIGYDEINQMSLERCHAIDGTVDANINQGIIYRNT